MIKLYFFRGSGLFIGKALDTGIHRHHLLEIFISLGGHLKIKKNNKFYEAKNIIIDSDEEHQLEGINNFYAILLFDSESLIARKLTKLFLNDSKINILPDSLFSQFHNDLKILYDDCEIEKAKEISNKIINNLLNENEVELKIIDPRIEKVISLLNKFPEKKAVIKKIADEVFLSESRLIHLFTKQIGIPIRHYLLWLRLLDAIDLIIKGKTFTYAAYETGFSDSAHLSRTFKKMFGLKLLEVFKNYKNSRFIQVITEKF